MIKYDLYWILNGKAKNFTLITKLIFWTGFAVWLIPLMMFVCIVMILACLLQLFYVIRYPLDLYLYNLLKGKGGKPKLKMIID